MLGDFRGDYMVALNIDDKASKILWLIGALSFVAAARSYYIAFTR
ncbi:MAG TPA: hypothetical protein VGF56_02885 [Rhizomicrobium sp.]|jgi:hypothetical protein